ncbi:MAG: amidohydrolase family protein [Betaproteobacteria bacterium]
MSEAIRTYLEVPSRPSLQLPALACDAHVHVFGPAERFAYAASRNFTPVDAPRQSLFALHRLLGIERCVVVQSAVHGWDNSAVEDTLTEGEGRYLGVALVPPDVADQELARLAAAGFRGVRFNFMKHLSGGATPEQVLALTERLAPIGLHLQLHFESSLIHSLAPMIRRSRVPVMIDHMGRVDAAAGADAPDFQALCELLRDERVHMKVSGIDRIDPRPPQDPAPYAHGVKLAQLLVREFGSRCVWGTDWPHPNHTHIPDDGQLVDALAQIAPEAAERQALLVDNPARFYRF